METVQEYSVFDTVDEQREYATTGQRFANFIVDMIVGYLLVLGLIFAMAITIPPFRDFALTLNDGSIGSKLLDRLLTTILLALVFTVIEGAGKGRTLGKLITGTRAVNFEDGAPITWKQAFQRSFSRMVPFEPFSGFSGNPWHDKWSNTTVIKVRK